MGTPSAKRISAKLGNAPARNALNITGANGKVAGSPISIKVAESLRPFMASGKQDNPASPGAGKYVRKNEAKFGDKNQILQSATKKVNGSFADKMPGSKGSANMKGVD